MADLKPLGSEKLEGMEKIQRILEIARFRETTPNPVNETSKSEYSLKLADGNDYHIVREKSGYIIKQSMNESTKDYIAPIQDRKYFDSYSQALKRLNLMAKEMNEKYENEEGTSLFSEQKKFTLKTPNSQKKNTNPTEDVENVPPPPPAPNAGGVMPPPPPPPSDMGSDVPPPPPSDMDTDVPSDMDLPMGDEGTTEPVGDEDHDEVVTFKLIQKLTGKLGQKLRALNSDEENQMSSKDIKYVINSILSALDLNNLDENDREDIINKFEGIEADEEMNDFGDEDEDEMSDFGDENDEESSEELGEGTWTDLGSEIATKTAGKAGMVGAMLPGKFDVSEEDDDNKHIQHIADHIFMEAKVEDILVNYFLVTENEQKYNDEINNDRLKKKKIKVSEVSGEIKRLSETVQQEIGAKKFLKENTDAILVGKTNKKNLVFELGNKQVKVSPKGNLI